MYIHPRTCYEAYVSSCSCRLYLNYLKLKKEVLKIIKDPFSEKDSPIAV